jgi:hypothetical protein
MKTITKLLLSLLLVTTASCQEVRTVKVTVTEEDGTPIKDATATVIFLGYGNDGKKEKAGLTDAKGKFEASGTTSGRMHVRVEKKGYYETNSGRLSRKEDHDVTYVLRKIKKPIPLYARKVRLDFPVNKEWLGFDFLIGDWVEPHGKGISKDALFRCDTIKTGERDASGSVEIKFGKEEGLFIVKDDFSSESELKLPHIAPENGYKSIFKRTEKSYHNKNFQNDLGYFFRVKTKETSDKQVTMNYGKILNDIRFSPRHYTYQNKPDKFATVSFTYYFNPTPNDRNLEFDPKQNLFKDLDSTERVHEP